MSNLNKIKEEGEIQFGHRFYNWSKDIVFWKKEMLDWHNKQIDKAFFLAIDEVEAMIDGEHQEGLQEGQTLGEWRQRDDLRLSLKQKLLLLKNKEN